MNQQETHEQKIDKYRDYLVETIRIMNINFDRWVLTLSGGGLAISIPLLRDLVTTSTIEHSYLLFSAWIAFVGGLISPLLGLFFGIRAHKEAIRQVDDESIYEQRPGRGYAITTTVFHVSGLVSLVVGLVLLPLFALLNIGIGSL